MATIEMSFEEKKQKGRRIYNGKQIDSQKHFDREARKASGDFFKKTRKSTKNSKGNKGNLRAQLYYGWREE